MIHRVFLYGTLKECFRPRTEDELDSLSRVDIRSTLYYPAVVVPGPYRVKGFVVQVDTPTLERLDTIEGVDWGLFNQTQCITDKNVSCLVYTYNKKFFDELPPLANEPHRNITEIPSTDQMTTYAWRS